MFENVLFVPARNTRVRAAALPVAALAHGLLVLGLVVIPLMRMGDLPPVELTGVFVAPALPAPPPPPPAARGRHPAPASRIKRSAPAGGGGAMALVTPVEIPNAISEEALGANDYGEGIEGGVDYAAAGGYPKDLIGEALFKVIGNEAAPVRAMGEVKMPRLIRRVEPDYPELARQSRIEGVVVLEATTDAFGRVADVRVLRSVPLVDEAAIAAVRQWLYEPMVVNGRPRGVVFTVTLRFQLKS